MDSNKVIVGRAWRLALFAPVIDALEAVFNRETQAIKTRPP